MSRRNQQRFDSYSRTTERRGTVTGFNQDAAASCALNRRIAQWQSTSIHTEGVAVFESCSAYQESMHPLADARGSSDKKPQAHARGYADREDGAVIFLSHC